MVQNNNVVILVGCVCFTYVLWRYIQCYASEIHLVDGVSTGNDEEQT